MSTGPTPSGGACDDPGRDAHHVIGRLRGQLENARTFWRAQSTNGRYAIVLGGVIGGLALIALASETMSPGDAEFVSSSYSSEGTSAGYAPPPRATDPEFSEGSGAGDDTLSGVALTNEATTLLLDIDLISRTSASPCMDILLIRSKVNRVWAILAELDSMDIGSAMEARMDEAVAGVRVVENDTRAAERLCS